MHFMKHPVQLEIIIRCSLLIVQLRSMTYNELDIFCNSKEALTETRSTFNIEQYATAYASNSLNATVNFTLVLLS